MKRCETPYELMREICYQKVAIDKLKKVDNRLALRSVDAEVRRGATLEVLAAVKRWLRAKDQRDTSLRINACERDAPAWPLVHKTQKALEDLEEAARKLELAK